MQSPRYWPVWFGLLPLRLVPFLPHRLLIGLGSAIGWCLYQFGRRRRLIAKTNLQLCFPKLSDTERRSLLKAHFRSLGISFLEIPLAWWGRGHRLELLARIEGLEHLLRAQQEGTGVVLLSAHFTSLELGGRLLSQFARFQVVYRRHEHPVIERLLSENRTRLFQKAIPRDDIRAMIRSLKQKETIWYAPDQNLPRSKALFVDFLGQSAATSPATARIARMTAARVVPFFVIRDKKGSGYKLIIEPALEAFPSDDLTADTQRVSNVIEKWVERYPEQYLWVHRRFKTRKEIGDLSPYL